MLRVAAAIVLFAASHGLASAADGDASPYDGKWNVTLTCPPLHDDEDAKGYVHRFPGEIRSGVLSATHGKEGEPGWHFLSGPIGGDGTAELTLHGLVNNPEYAIHHAQRGKPYVYRVRARFEGSSGVGRRIGKRQCEFLFQRA